MIFILLLFPALRLLRRIPGRRRGRVWRSLGVDQGRLHDQVLMEDFQFFCYFGEFFGILYYLFGFMIRNFRRIFSIFVTFGNFKFFQYFVFVLQLALLNGIMDNGIIWLNWPRLNKFQMSLNSMLCIRNIFSCYHLVTGISYCLVKMIP